MQTLEIKLDNGGVARVHHDGAWDGPATIILVAPPAAPGQILRRRDQEITIPAEILVAIGRACFLEKFRADTISYLKQYEGGE